MNQNDLTAEQKKMWNNSVDKIVQGLNELCWHYYNFNLDEIKGYSLSESLDEYPFKFISMRTGE